MTETMSSVRAGKYVYRLFSALCLGFALSIQLSCQTGANVRITTTVPVPLVESYPVTVGVYLPPELKDFEYNEKITNHGEFQVNLGDSQTVLFERVFKAMFADVRLLQEPEQLPDGLDGVLIPKVNEVQIAIPQQTRSDFYEVWINYAIDLKDADGKHIHSWSFAAYGKANRRNYTNPMDRSNAALEHAADSALRDVAVIILFSFAKQQPIKDWLQSV